MTEVLESDSPNRDRRELLLVTLKEKLDTIKSLDAAIIDLIDDEEELTAETE